jgi:hypothetical protein
MMAAAKGLLREIRAEACFLRHAVSRQSEISFADEQQNVDVIRFCLPEVKVEIEVVVARIP